MILLVNRNHLFNEDILDDIEIVEYENYDEKIIYVERETFRHFEMLKAHLRVDGIDIDIEDAYRSLESQENIFLKSMMKYGMDYAEQHEDMPGFCEHHTGQALDLAIIKDEKRIIDIDGWIKEEKITRKIYKSLKYFGFILRYPLHKEIETGHEFEPWHIRYIGENAAMEIGSLVLEEYLTKIQK